MFVNYNAEFFYEIIYRLVVGNYEAKPFPDDIRDTKIFEWLKEIFEENNGIEEKYKNAKSFEFHRSYFEVEKYKQLY